MRPPRARTVYNLTGGDWDPVFGGTGTDPIRSPTSASSSTWARSTRPPTACSGSSLELEGETVTDARVVVGYLHTGIEKNTEYRNWTQGVTFVTRADYLSPIFNETAYCLGVEKAARHRGSGARPPDPHHDDGDQPALLALGVAGHRRHGTRRADRDDQRLPRPGEVPGHLRGRHRAADEQRLRPSRRCRPRICPRVRPRRSDATTGSCSWTRNSAASRSCCAARPIWVNRLKDVGWIGVEGCLALGVTGPLLRAAGLPWDLRKTDPYLGYEEFDFEVPTDDRGDCWARFVVRVAEMWESLKIVEAGAGPARARPDHARRPEGRLAGQALARPGRHWATRSSTSARSWGRRWNR